MRTTITFNNGVGKRSLTSETDTLNDAIGMFIYRAKRRRKNAQKNIIVYDEETHHLRVGQGPIKEMELISGTRVFDTITDLPPEGKTDTLYVLLDTGTMYVWNNSAKTWLPINASNGSSGIPVNVRDQVLVYINASSFPVKGEKNTLYVTKAGEAYIYDTSANKYVSVTKGPGYTKAEADAKFASKDTSYTKDESDQRYTQKEYSYSKLESDIKYASRKDLNAIKNDIEAGPSHTLVKDIFDVDNISVTKFSLSKEPADDVSLYINGVLYVNTDNETNYSVDKSAKTLTWLNTDSNNGGFTLEGSIVTIEYNPTKD